MISKAFQADKRRHECAVPEIILGSISYPKPTDPEPGLLASIGSGLDIVVFSSSEVNSAALDHTLLGV
jgi:hypothetical protein